jgi:type I restriction enzyme S subunit
VNWTEANLGTLTLKIGSGATPTGGGSSYKQTGISLIRSQNVYDFEFALDGLAFIDEQQAARLHNVELQPDDILLNITGDSIGRCCIVPKSILPARVNQHVAIIRTNGRIVPRFLLYYINSPRQKQELLSKAHGATRNAFTKGLLEQFAVRFPSLPHQRGISEILGSLDDKIDCNRSINDLLLKMALTLFQHWFVDFGPFKKRGLQDSDIGPIPKGWAAQPILDCCTLLGGGTPKTSVDEYWNGDVLWTSAKDVSQCGAAYLLDTERKITRLGVENSATQILPKGTVVIIARGATTGKFAALGRDMAMNQTCYGLRGKDGFSQEWVYLMLADVVPTLQQAAHGTIFDTITTTTFQTTNIVVPPRPVLDDFADKVKPLFDQMLANLKENQLLAQTRDYLLPKLLSGEVEVKAADKESEAFA